MGFMGRTFNLLAAVALVASTLGSTPAQAATFTYPSAACSGTLQDCIDGAPSGSTIKIATNEPIITNTDMTIEDKSLTLRPKAGFHPVLKGTSPGEPYSLRLRATTGSDPTTMKVTGITTRELRVHLGSFDDDGARHKFILSNSHINQSYQHNNLAGVDVDLRSPATAIVLHNVVRSNGQPIKVFHDSTIGRTYARIEANRVTSIDPAYSYVGIENRFDGSSLGTTDIFDNVVDDSAGCNCGGPAGISSETIPGGNGRVNIVGNTINHVRLTYPGVVVRASAPSTHVVKVFNNTISRAGGGAVSFPAAQSGLKIANDYNNFFNNDGPSAVGGYPLGSHTSHLDPRFEDAADGNFRLRRNSSLIDRGLICQSGGLGRMDAAEHFRFVKPTVDIGAYEFGSSQKPPKGKNVFGDNRNNHLDGTRGKDIMCGLGGGDVITARSKTDWVYAGPGSDRAYGQSGPDVVRAGKGNGDSASGGSGADLVITKDGGGGDTANGNRGNDTCKTDGRDHRNSC